MIEQTPQGTTKATLSKAEKRKRLKKIHVSEPTANGGRIVTHHYHPEHGGTPKADKHTFASDDDMRSHVEQTMRGHRG